MPLDLPPLFHWSPAARRGRIRREGLRPGRPASVGSVTCVGFPGRWDDGEPPVQVLCFGFDPAGAWALSGDMPWARDGAVWDLWQVWIADSDEVAVLPTYGPRLREVRVANPIPKRRIRWIGERVADGRRW